MVERPYNYSYDSDPRKLQRSPPQIHQLPRIRLRSDSKRRPNTNLVLREQHQFMVFGHEGYINLKRDKELGEKMSHIIFVKARLWNKDRDNLLRERITVFSAPRNPVRDKRQIFNSDPLPGTTVRLTSSDGAPRSLPLVSKSSGEPARPGRPSNIRAVLTGRFGRRPRRIGGAHSYVRGCSHDPAPAGWEQGDGVPRNSCQAEMPFGSGGLRGTLLHVGRCQLGSGGGIPHPGEFA